MRISILSRAEAGQLAKDNPNLFNEYKVISIGSVDDGGPLFTIPHKNVLALTFDDIEERPDRDPFYDEWSEFMDRGLDYFTEAQAKQVVDFLHAFSPEDRLVVHCFAGISRSGGVGVFAAQLLGESVVDLLVKHPRVMPNRTVLRKLRDAHAKKLEPLEIVA